MAKGRRATQATATPLERAQAVLDQFDEGRTRPLDRNERHDIRVIVQRARIAARRISNEVELSPYLKALMQREEIK